MRDQADDFRPIPYNTKDLTPIEERFLLLSAEINPGSTYWARPDAGNSHRAEDLPDEALRREGRKWIKERLKINARRELAEAIAQELAAA